MYRSAFELQNHLDEGHFNINFRPQYDIETMRAVAFHTITNYSSDYCLPEKKESYMNIKGNQNFNGLFDVRLFNEVCKYQEQSLVTAGTIIPVIISLSASTICNPYHVYDIAMNIKGRHLPPNSIKLALTFDHTQLTADRLSKSISFLQQNGLNIILDHFGPDLDLFFLFQYFAFDQIKIDRLFFKESLHSAQKNMLLEQLIETAQILNIPLIFDGIDTLTELQYFKETGEKYALGNFWGKPISRDPSTEGRYVSFID